MQMQTNAAAIEAGRNERIREQLIAENEKTILSTAAVVCRKYITKNDDEWTVALLSFSKAIDRYTGSKGDFLPFAKKVIRNGLVDYYRKNTGKEIAASPYVLQGTAQPQEDVYHVYPVIVQKSMDRTGDDIREEITQISAELQQHDISFFALAQQSPRQKKTKAECARAIQTVTGHEDRCRELRRTGKLPIRQIEEESGVSRKTLDRYRKYLIMAILVLSGDYPYLSEYLSYAKGAKNESSDR